jgi:hypothetical protein
MSGIAPIFSVRFNTGYGNISPKNCFKGGQGTNCRLNNLVYLAALAGERISLWFFGTADHKTMESALRSTLKLAWNIHWPTFVVSNLFQDHLLALGYPSWHC